MTSQPRSSARATRRVRVLIAAGAAAAALVGATAGAAHAADSGLSARWDLDAATPANNGSSWQFADSSGNGLTAEGWVQPTFVTGKWGNAVRFGTGRGLGASGNAPGSAGIETPAGTLSLWFRTAVAPGEVKYLAAKGAPVSCENATYAIYTGFSAAGTPTQPHNVGLQGYLHDGTDTAYTAMAPGNPYDGQWHAIAIVFKDGFVRLYVDGVPRGTRGMYPFTTPGADIAQPRYDDWPFMIGDNPSPACGDQTFNGSIDEVRFYSRALGDAEITRLHDPASPTPPNVDLPAPPPAAPADPDHDGDGAPGSKDCNDADPRINPGAPEVKGNAVDENCDGNREQWPTLNATSVLSWKLLRSGRTTLTSLAIEGVRDGDRVTIACTGGGCKKKTNRTVTLTKVKKNRYRLASAVKGLSLKPKATLTVTVSRDGFASRVISYRTVKRRDPKRESHCQDPGAKATYVC